MFEGGEKRRAEARLDDGGAGRPAESGAELDPRLAAVARELRRPVALDAALDDRIMAAVATTPLDAAEPEGARAGGEPAPAVMVRAWRWLRRPRTVRVSPLAGGLVGLAGLAAAAALTVVVLGADDGRGSPLAEVTAADAAPAAAPAPDSVVVHQFVLVAPNARSVALVGDFNDWQVGATTLRPAASGQVWTVEVSLAPGRHRYAFVVDDETWVADPTAPRAPGADFGAPSSVITIAERRAAERRS